MIACIGAFVCIGKLLFSGSMGKQGGASIEHVCENKCRYVRKMEYLFAGIVIIVCCVSILTILLAGDSEAFTNFSFASTVASIILSVIAIFMTISGESKASTTKDKIDLTVELLNKSISGIDNQKESFDTLLVEFKEQVKYQQETYEKLLKVSHDIHEDAVQIIRAREVESLPIDLRSGQKKQYKHKKMIMEGEE